LKKEEILLIVDVIVLINLKKKQLNINGLVERIKKFQYNKLEEIFYMNVWYFVFIIISV